jgi:hypothetical protein
MNCNYFFEWSEKFILNNIVLYRREKVLDIGWGCSGRWCLEVLGKRARMPEGSVGDVVVR